MGQDCKYCGAYIAGDAESCPACGRRVKSAPSYGAAAATAEAYEAEVVSEPEKTAKSENTAYTYKNEFERRYGKPSSAHRAGSYNAEGGAYDSERFTDDDVRENRGICFLCYLGLLFLVPYLTKRDSDFVKFHSNQGLLLLIVEALVALCSEIFLIGWLIRIVGTVFAIVCFVQGMINVSNGVKKPLPIIGTISILK